MSKKMRVVRVFETKLVTPDKWETKSLGLAWFHQWGVDYEEFETGPGNFSVAIVEFADGTVKTVPAESVNFQGQPAGKDANHD